MWRWRYIFLTRPDPLVDNVNVVYGDDMKEAGIDAIRNKLGDYVNAALYRGEHTVITRAGKPAAVIVPVEWYEKAREALGGDA